MASSSFKKWEPEGEDAAEIFRLLEAGTLSANREEAWKKYSQLKEHWIDKIYKRKNLGANFRKTFKRFFEYKATLQGPCIGSLTVLQHTRSSHRTKFFSQERNRSFSRRQGSSFLFSILLKQRPPACELGATTARSTRKRRTSLEDSVLALSKNSLLTTVPSRRTTKKNQLEKPEPKFPFKPTTRTSNSSHLALAD
jgi:hypothetical protein